ncbi:MAG: hypothetical protein AAF806_26120 [Bacteroidota bacterium]
MEHTTYNYFIKGDVSGIQDFIFNVKSEKAARVLKARSVFVEVLTKFSKQFVLQHLNLSETPYSFDGGGSFYVFAEGNLSIEETHEKLKTLESFFNEQFHRENIYVTFSIIEEVDDFSVAKKELEYQSQLDKLKKYNFQGSALAPFKREAGKKRENCFGDKWKEDEVVTFEVWLEKKVVTKKGEYMIAEIVRYLTCKMGERVITWQNESIPRVDLPTWTSALWHSYEEEIQREEEKRSRAGRDDARIGRETIIDYQFLAHFAKERTGTNKIGILKMDVDNLGYLFTRIPSKQLAFEVSELLSNFFSNGIQDLLREKIVFNYPVQENRTDPSTYQNNIYTVFSGGDDCIFVGAWDAILELAPKIKMAFETTAQRIKDKLDKAGVHEDKDLKLPPTLSAGVEIVEPTYPVVQFASLSEEALKKGKSFRFHTEKEAKQRPSKNKITVFEQSLTWEEWKKAHHIAYNVLKINIESQPPKISRAILERIRQSERLFKSQYEEALEGNTSIPGVSKLFYFARNVGSKEVVKELHNQLITPYAQDLITAFTDSEATTNPMKYPVAARWAELLTRKNK